MKISLHVNVTFTFLVFMLINARIRRDLFTTGNRLGADVEENNLRRYANSALTTDTGRKEHNILSTLSHAS